MIYLLDVNVLLALRYVPHTLHARAMTWLSGLTTAEQSPRLATCSLTELGFIRVASGPAGWAQGVSLAIEDLQKIKDERPMSFLNDDVPGHDLPDWVRKPKHVTDGHLLRLAAKHGGVLVTLDRGIPGATLIPEVEHNHPSVHEPFHPYGVAA